MARAPERDIDMTGSKMEIGTVAKGNLGLIGYDEMAQALARRSHFGGAFVTGEDLIDETALKAFDAINLLSEPVPVQETNDRYSLMEHGVNEPAIRRNVQVFVPVYGGYKHGKRVVKEVRKIDGKAMALKAAADRREAKVEAARIRRDETIKAQALKAVAAKVASSTAVDRLIPTRRSAVNTQKVATATARQAVATATRPEGADALGRVQTPAGLAVRCTCPCGNLVLVSSAMVPSRRDAERMLRQNVVGAWDLWKLVRAKGHGRFSVIPFTEALEGIQAHESGLPNNNMLLSGPDGVSHRPSAFVVEISEEAHAVVGRILAKRSRRPQDWRALHAALGTDSDTRVIEARKAAITKWDAHTRGLTAVVDLRELVTLCFDAKGRRDEQRTRDIKQAAWKKRQAQQGGSRF